MISSRISQFLSMSIDRTLQLVKNDVLATVQNFMTQLRSNSHPNQHKKLKGINSSIHRVLIIIRSGEYSLGDSGMDIMDQVNVMKLTAVDRNNFTSILKQNSSKNAQFLNLLSMSQSNW